MPPDRRAGETAGHPVGRTVATYAEILSRYRADASAVGFIAKVDAWYFGF